MRHSKNHENDVVRHYWLFDEDEIERFREALRRIKSVKCISRIAANVPVAVQGNANNLGRFEDDVFR